MRSVSVYHKNPVFTLVREETSFGRSQKDSTTPILRLKNGIGCINSKDPRPGTV